MYNVFKCFTLCINCLLLFSDLQSQDMKIHHKNMFSKITTVSMLWPLFFFQSLGYLFTKETTMSVKSLRLNMRHVMREENKKNKGKYQQNI